MDSVLNINKPMGMTSHDVVDGLRRILNEKKAGHTGTLDPDATGVLPVCFGKATKIIQFIQDHEKGYQGTATLGVITDTMDSGGKILSISDGDQVDNIDLNEVRVVFNSFIGEIEQIPPMVSAIKVQGRRLYKLARQGKSVSRRPRKIRIYELEVTGFYKEEEPRVHPSRLFTRIDFQVRCSKGTYIRSLVSDIGDALGCGAHLSRLVRTKSGIFELKDSVSLEEIRADPGSALKLGKTIDEVLYFMPVIVIADRARSRFLNGVPVRRSEVINSENSFQIGDLVRIHDEADMLLGICRAVGGSEVYSSEALDPQTVICKAIKVLM